MSDRLTLRDVRAVFRLIGDIRAAGVEPAQWRTLMIIRLGRLFQSELVISSEVHVRAIPGKPSNSIMRITDLGWGCDGSGKGSVWQIHSETDTRPEGYLLSLLPGRSDPGDPDVAVPVRHTLALRAGRTFVLSQYLLPHLGTVDQLGLHKDASQKPFTPAQHRLIRLFHLELGRLWRKDALEKARDPKSDLPPRLLQTLRALQDGCSEKEVSHRLGISQHTVHNYVKVLHQRFGASSRSELLAKTRSKDTFLPQFS